MKDLGGLKSIKGIGKKRLGSAVMDKVVLFAALLTSLFNLLGILYNHYLSKKLRISDKDDEEKRELRRKIHDRLAEFENDALPDLHYIKKIADRLMYLARNVKRYDETLSTMIKIFKNDWKKGLTFSDGTPVIRPSPSDIEYFKNLAEIIGEKADNLLENLSFTKRVKIWLSWLRFRVSLAKKNWQENSRFK